MYIHCIHFEIYECFWRGKYSRLWFLIWRRSIFVQTCKFLSKNLLFSEPWLTLCLHHLFNITKLFQWKMVENTTTMLYMFSLFVVNFWITTFLKTLYSKSVKISGDISGSVSEISIALKSYAALSITFFFWRAWKYSWIVNTNHRLWPRVQVVKFVTVDPLILSTRVEINSL